MSVIEKIAGVHLGKAGDGSAVKPYVTPDDIDSSLLVAVPRELNRTAYGITAEPPFAGYDAWNAYEFSTLLSNGYPVSGWLKLTYSAYSFNIVESKSLKLYLNSFNMARKIKSLKDISYIERRIQNDVGACVNSYVHAKIRLNNNVPLYPPVTGTWTRLEDLCSVESIEFSHYNESPDILSVVNNTSKFPQKFTTNALRSNCRVTNQPDWGDVYIYIDGAKTVTPESLMQYIVSMRKENHFHEEVCECIYKRLWDLLKPSKLFVGCLYTRRGGIDINPIRASSMDLLEELAPITDPTIFCEKTMRQ